MNKEYFRNQKGLTLVEILIGILITTLMMGALYTTYNVVNNTYSQVSEKAKISRSSRDLVSMLMRDIRMAGFKYYAGSQTIAKFAEDTNKKRSCNPGLVLPNKSYLTFDNGFNDHKLSHNPIVIRKNRLGFQTSSDGSDSIKSKANSTNKCCDQIEIVYEDFNQNDLDQPFKRYRITYYADEKIGEKNIVRLAVYKTVESWRQERVASDVAKIGEDEEICIFPATGGQWVTDCPQCIEKDLVRDHIEDMEFIPFDRDGLIIRDSAGNYPAPEIDNLRDRLFDIAGVDVRLTFRSKDNFYKETQKREVVGLDDRKIEAEDRLLRDSVIVTVNTRNIGGTLF
jgi:Tfp pilus assembly protein PilE